MVLVRVAFRPGHLEISPNNKTFSAAALRSEDAHPAIHAVRTSHAACSCAAHGAAGRRHCIRLTSQMPSDDEMGYAKDVRALRGTRPW